MVELLLWRLMALCALRGLEATHEPGRSRNILRVALASTSMPMPPLPLKLGPWAAPAELHATPFSCP